jgi:hypothetical protein
VTLCIKGQNEDAPQGEQRVMEKASLIGFWLISTLKYSYSKLFNTPNHCGHHEIHFVF